MGTEQAIKKSFWKSAEFYRDLFSRAALPVLALSASKGVLDFTELFVPFEWALVTMCAFELTYLGLSIVSDLTPDQRKRANRIAWAAVAVSIIYNIVSGFLAFWGDDKAPRLSLIKHLPEPYNFLTMAVLAILHGVPLALLAYQVANLLLHKTGWVNPLQAAHDFLANRVKELEAFIANAREESEAQIQRLHTNYNERVEALKKDMAKLQSGYDEVFNQRADLATKIEMLQTVVESERNLRINFKQGQELWQETGRKLQAAQDRIAELEAQARPVTIDRNGLYNELNTILGKLQSREFRIEPARQALEEVLSRYA